MRRTGVTGSELREHRYQDEVVSVVTLSPAVSWILNTPFFCFLHFLSSFLFLLRYTIYSPAERYITQRLIFHLQYRSVVEVVSYRPASPPEPSSPVPVSTMDAPVVDHTSLGASPTERRNSLERHLQMRPEAKDLKDRHILLDTSVAPYVLWSPAYIYAIYFVHSVYSRLRHGVICDKD